ncbi:MAG TPA: hypothetical protein VFD73_03100, partial [Gemmatimonadales bacterium]|nr:hypothetical protein [Gemmatimonadales bacterium]
MITAFAPPSRFSASRVIARSNNIVPVLNLPNGPAAISSGTNLAFTALRHSQFEIENLAKPLQCNLSGGDPMNRALLFPALITLAGLGACSNDQSTGPSASSGTEALLTSQTGNGAPSGAHYNLNIIGVPKDKSPNFTGGDGHRIFVDLGKTGQVANTRINLREGDFQVLDANGTDGTAAFQLPNPDPDGDGTTSYSVYVRALGKPGGKASLQSCYEDATGTWCAVNFPGGVEPITVERSKGGVAKFDNVSKDLLFIDFCTAWSAGLDGILGTQDDVCTSVDQVPLFSNNTLSYLWSYDNEGL